MPEAYLTNVFRVNFKSSNQLSFKEGVKNQMPYAELRLCCVLYTGQGHGQAKLTKYLQQGFLTNKLAQLEMLERYNIESLIPSCKLYDELNIEQSKHQIP